MVGAGAPAGPSPIDQNMLSDLCFFGASKAPPPTDGFLKPTYKPKFETSPKTNTPSTRVIPTETECFLLS